MNRPTPDPSQEGTTCSARDNLRFMAAMHDVGIVEASRESTHLYPFQPPSRRSGAMARREGGEGN